MGLSRQEYWSGLPFPSPEDPPDLGTEPRSPVLQAWATRETSTFKYIPSFLPIQVTTEHWAEFSMLYSRFSLIIYFIHTDGDGGLVSKACLTLATQWTVACQAPLSMEFSRQEYWWELAIHFSRGYSWLRDQTHISCVSCIAGRFFTHCGIGEAPKCIKFRAISLSLDNGISWETTLLPSRPVPICFCGDLHFNGLNDAIKT